MVIPQPGSGSASSLIIKDMTAGRPGHGNWLIRFDHPHGKKAQFYHINRNAELLGLTDDPHTKIPAWIVKSAPVGARIIRSANRVAVPVAIAGDTIMLMEAFETDQEQFGHETKAAIGSVTGGWAGALAGAEMGAVAGGLIGSMVPVVGTAIGAILGGVVGGIAGSIGGSYLGENAAREYWR
ncbi:MAG: hypothetical protein EPO21_23560 [Chloroflexota bacterium]|nr:MAG: hypothetical protein EPO21_23560 [Chloroflexota bacterium]